MANFTLCPDENISNVTSVGSKRTNSSVPKPQFSDYDCHVPSYILLVLVTGYFLVMLVGLSGNLCLIHVIKLQRETHNVTNLLIANLSISDGFICVMCIPFTIVYTLMDYWVFGETMCKVSNFVQCLSVSVSSFSLVLIAVERYQLIINPRGWKPNIVQACWGIAFIWLGSATMSVPFLVFYRLTDEPFRNISHGFYQGKFACVESWPSEWERLGFTTCLLGVQYFAPLFFIFVCYARVFVCLRRRRILMECLRESASRLSASRLSTSKRLNATLVSIVVAFAICWMPLNIFNLVFDWHHKALLNCHHNLLFTLCHLVAMASTCINPVFYGLLNKNFQKDLGNITRRCKCESGPEENEIIGMSIIHSSISKGLVKLNNTTDNQH